MLNAAEYRTAMLGRRREAVDARLPHGGQAINYGYHLRAVIDAAWLRDWQFPAEHGDLHELADGGHHFLRTRPTEAAQAALRIPRWCDGRRSAKPQIGY